MTLPHTPRPMHSNEPFEPMLLKITYRHLLVNIILTIHQAAQQGLVSRGRVGSRYEKGPLRADAAGARPGPSAGLTHREHPQLHRAAPQTVTRDRRLSGSFLTAKIP